MMSSVLFIVMLLSPLSSQEVQLLPSLEAREVRRIADSLSAEEKWIQVHEVYKFLLSTGDNSHETLRKSANVAARAEKFEYADSLYNELVTQQPCLFSIWVDRLQIAWQQQHSKQFELVLQAMSVASDSCGQPVYLRLNSSTQDLRLHVSTMKCAFDSMLEFSTVYFNVDNRCLAVVKIEDEFKIIWCDDKIDMIPTGGLLDYLQQSLLRSH